jgi:hypothetical protein
MVNNNMKQRFDLIIALFVLMFLSACESDKDVAWGYSKLYIPQAILQSGGLNNNFVVKVNLANTSDTSIVVGLYRSGLEKLESVSVDLGVNTDTLTNAIAIANQTGSSSIYNIYKTASLLPATYYQLPEKIEIKNGFRESSVKLIIKRSNLNDDVFFKTVGNRYILPVYISNPTKYELNKQLSLTMFIFEQQ